MKKNKIKLAIFLALFSILTFSETNGKNKKIYRNSTGEVIELEVEGISENIEIEDSDEDIIFLDELEEEKKEEKKSRIEKLINKIDSKVNPVLKFYTPASYGAWYVIKTGSEAERSYENMKYNFRQEESGYRIVKTYFNKETGVWSEKNERGWIREEKDKVYLGTEKKLFRGYKNEILFFDDDYKYMIIYFEQDRTIRVFSRVPSDKITLNEEDRKKFDGIVSGYRLYDIAYDRAALQKYESNSKEIMEQKSRAEMIEKQIMDNPEEFFKLNK